MNRNTDYMYVEDYAIDWDEDELCEYMNALDKEGAASSQTNVELPPFEEEDEAVNMAIIEKLKSDMRALVDDVEDRPFNVVEKLALERVMGKDEQDVEEEEGAGKSVFAISRAERC